MAEPSKGHGEHTGHGEHMGHGGGVGRADQGGKVVSAPQEVMGHGGGHVGMLRPEIAALSMSGSSLIVAVNALLLKRLKLPEVRRPAPSPRAAEEPTPVAHQ